MPFMLGSLLACSFFPCGDVPDLDQPCLSTSAVHKGSRGKLFILTSFRENKPHTLGASGPSTGVPNSAEGQQLSLCGHNYRPGSGYRRCCVQVPCVMSELRVQPCGNLKITAHGGRYSCPSPLQWQKRHDITLMVI